MTNYFKLGDFFSGLGFLSMMGLRGCGMPNATGINLLILRTEFVFHSVIRKRSKLSSSFTQTAETYCAASNKEQPATPIFLYTTYHLQSVLISETPI